MPEPHTGRIHPEASYGAGYEAGMNGMPAPRRHDAAARSFPQPNYGATPMRRSPAAGRGPVEADAGPGLRPGYALRYASSAPQRQKSRPSSRMKRASTIMWTSVAPSTSRAARAAR
jgi:hypothetical protein